MKKTIIALIVALIAIVIAFTYRYNVYKNEQLLIQKLQKEFEYYTEGEILGTSLMTLINKSIDLNRKNGIELDSNNLFIENETNSIKIDIKFLESDTYFPMERIEKYGAPEFIKNYAGSSFECTKKEYHDKTKNVKYLLFEEVQSM